MHYYSVLCLGKNLMIQELYVFKLFLSVSFSNFSYFFDAFCRRLFLYDGKMSVSSDFRHMIQ